MPVTRAGVARRRSKEAPWVEIEETLEFSNAALLLALRDLTADPIPERLRAFYHALGNSTILLLAPQGIVDDPSSDPEDIPLLTFVDDAGEDILIAFTDEDAALAWDPDGPALVALRGLDLVLIADHNAIDAVVLNPGGLASYRLHRSEYQAAASGELTPLQGGPRSMPAGTTILVAPPEAQPPESWLRTVRRVLNSYPSIDAAYLFLMRMAPEGARNVIGLALHRGMTPDAQSALVDAVLAEFESILPDGWTLDFVVLDDPDFLAVVADTVPPIHTRA